VSGVSGAQSAKQASVALAFPTDDLNEFLPLMLVQLQLPCRGGGNGLAITIKL
jgi:hypothetical protein